MVRVRTPSRRQPLQTRTIWAHQHESAPHARHREREHAHPQRSARHGRPELPQPPRERDDRPWPSRTHRVLDEVVQSRERGRGCQSGVASQGHEGLGDERGSAPARRVRALGRARAGVCRGRGGRGAMGRCRGGGGRLPGETSLDARKEHASGRRVGRRRGFGNPCASPIGTSRAATQRDENDTAGNELQMRGAKGTQSCGRGGERREARGRGPLEDESVRCGREGAARQEYHRGELRKRPGDGARAFEKGWLCDGPLGCADALDDAGAVGSGEKEKVVDDLALARDGLEHVVRDDAAENGRDRRQAQRVLQVGAGVRRDRHPFGQPKLGAQSLATFHQSVCVCGRTPAVGSFLERRQSCKGKETRPLRSKPRRKAESCWPQMGQRDVTIADARRWARMLSAHRRCILARNSPCKRGRPDALLRFGPRFQAPPSKPSPPPPCSSLPVRTSEQKVCWVNPAQVAPGQIIAESRGPGRISGRLFRGHLARFATLLNLTLRGGGKVQRASRGKNERRGKPKAQKRQRKF